MNQPRKHSLLNTRTYLCIIILLFSSLCNVFAAELVGKVVKVTDGDTITLLVGQTQKKIRLAEIDAPERKQPYSKKSKQALADMIAGQQVRVDVIDTDRYGRLIGQIYLDDMWVNGAMIRSGHAHVYVKYLLTDTLLDYQHQAIEQELGIWSLPVSEQVPPWEWRKSQRNNP